MNKRCMILVLLAQVPMTSWQVGSAEWVRQRVAKLSDDGWTARPECLPLAIHDNDDTA